MRPHEPPPLPSDAPAPGERPHVAALYVYPIKSLGGVAVASTAIGAFGPEHDRRWMLVDDDGTFLTQRSDPRMALVRVRLEDDGVTAAAPGLAPLRVTPPGDGAARRAVSVWNDTVDAASYGPDVDRWFAAALGRPCHLVYMPDDVWRQVDRTYAGPGDRTSFTDAFPLLLLTRESVGDLNARLAAKGVPPVDERRFRPNVVVAGAGAPFAEDGWGDVRLGEAAVRVVKPCARCALTTVNPDTAEVSPRGEPLRTLAAYRTRAGKVLFAQNAVVRGTGTVRVGDPVVAG